MSAPGARREDEEVLGKAYDARLMRRLVRWLEPSRGTVILAVLALLGASALELFEPWLTKIAIDRYVRSGDASGLPALAAAYVGILLAVFALRYAEDYLTARIGQATSLHLRTALFRHLQRLPMRYFDRTPVGRIMTRVVGDVDVLNEMFSSGVVAVCGDLFLLVGIVTAMLSLNVQLTLAAFLVIPPLAVATQLFRVRVRTAFREVRGKLARLNVFLQESIAGMSVLQLFRRERVDRERFGIINAEHRDAHLKTVFYHSLFYPVVEVLGAVAVGLIVWRGGGAVAAGDVSLGVLVAFIQYAKRFFQPIMDLSEKYTIMQSAMASAERVFELLDTPTDAETSASPRTLPPGRPELRLQNVWFAYRDEDWVLRDVTLTVPAGKTVAVVGATGAGKSTLAGLVLRFHDVGRGAVSVGGIDVREMDRSALRRRIAYVQQDVFLFSGTLADNIRLGEPMAESQWRDAAGAAGLTRTVERLSRGFDTDLRERGNLLSTGEKQLVALARALAFDPDVLVLDEATSSVDTGTEVQIQSAIERLARGRTALVIAHRLSTVRNADTIVVLHHGEVRECGNHEQLIQQSGLYRRLHDLQFAVGGAAADPGIGKDS